MASYFEEKEEIRQICLKVEYNYRIILYNSVNFYDDILHQALLRLIHQCWANVEANLCWNPSSGLYLSASGARFSKLPPNFLGLVSIFSSSFICQLMVIIGANLSICNQ